MAHWYKVLGVVAICMFGSVMVFLLIFNNNISKVSPKHVDREKREVIAKVETEKEWIKFDDFLNGKFVARSFYPYWVSENEYIQKIFDESLIKINIETEAEISFLNATDLSERYDWYSVSADQLYVATGYNSTEGYAHYVRTFSMKIYKVSDGSEVNVPNFPSAGIQKFKWSPNGHDMTFVYEFDVYLITDFNNQPTRMTSNGEKHMVFNGISDWLFWIEITDDDALLWWSPNGDYLAFATVHEAGVTQFEFILYKTLQYPEMVKLPYPKPGTAIPTTTVTIINVKLQEMTTLTPDLSSSWNDEYYLNSVAWRNTTFTPTWKNRVENETITENCDPPDFKCSHVSSMMTSSSTGWVGHYKVSHIYHVSSSEYLTVQSYSSYPHLAMINVDTNSIDWRTSGSFEVTDTYLGYTSIHYYDDTNDWVYFTSTELPENLGEGLPRMRHMWRVKGHGEDRKRTCITCELNNIYKDRCNWVTPTFSFGGSFVVVNCGGTANGVPISTLHKKNVAGDFEFVRVVENNTALQETLDVHYFRERIYGTIKLPDMEGDWYYTLLKPPNFDPNKKYPMLVQVYSGPGYQEVKERFSVSWKDYVASSLDVVVMSFDGRGTGFRGDEIMHMVYKRLGEYEPMDQIAAARIVSDENSFIDKTKTAIWGWSYGGYATSRVIGEDEQNVFKCGFSVAPVTSWKFYHTIYTERYMLQPKDNVDGYNNSVSFQKAENFAKHRFSLFHGTRDENVHFQNSAQLSKYLIENNVDFRAFFAADDDHGFGRVPNDYRNLLKMITSQMKICFDMV